MVVSQSPAELAISGREVAIKSTCVGTEDITLKNKVFECGACRPKQGEKGDCSTGGMSHSIQTHVPEHRGVPAG